jgi:hypothetical protein
MIGKGLIWPSFHHAHDFKIKRAHTVKKFKKLSHKQIN